MSVCAVVGGQFGSEGKGLIVGHIAKDYDYHMRVGAANAGHTLYVDGEKHVMQQIPCAAYANPYAMLMIGPGALISRDIFLAELLLLQKWRKEKGLPDPVVYVDYRAHVITESQVAREQLSDLADRIGSTSTIAKEGIGAAQADRVMRSADCVTADDVRWPGNVRIVDTPGMLGVDDGEKILLEGTQGTSLSLVTGFFPYVTSRITTSAGLAAECGIAPNRLSRIIVVCRSYPIRVAGSSGPFYPDSEEVSWDTIGVDPESERTTVTKKVRRVATWSQQQVMDAAELNGATEFALTFCDYIDPLISGERSRRLPWELEDLETYRGVKRRVKDIMMSGVPVTYLGTGPESIIELRS